MFQNSKTKLREIASPTPRSSKESHTEKSFRNIFKSTRNQIVFIRLIWNQTNIHWLQNNR